MRTELGLTKEALNGIQDGVKRSTYKGRPMLKCPFDLPIYLELLWEMKPASVVEIGSGHGGSALWFADTLSALGLRETRLYSFDLHPVRDLADPRITFGHLDVRSPGAYLTQEFLAGLPHPLLLIEDSSHRRSDVLKILEFFDPWLKRGDYIIVEDGIVEALGHGEKYDGGPLPAIYEFLARRPRRYQIDRTRCDKYGPNVTWNPDGYLRCIGP